MYLNWWFLWWWGILCLYFSNDELQLLSWLGKSLCDLYDWSELDELYAICEICVLCKMSKVAYRIIFSKWWVWGSLIIKLNKERSEKFLYWLMLLRWWDFNDDLIKEWLYLVCYDRNMITWFVLNWR